MENLTTLFKLLECTRLQPQYGYALAGVSKSEMSDLAQHHYMVGIIALLLGKFLNSRGAKLDIQKVLEIALTHDLGELLGGDINFYYSRSNLEARKKAKEFEAENIKYLSGHFGQYGKELEANTRSFEDKDSDEAIIAQCADKIECVHYKLQVGKIGKMDVQSTKISVLNYAKKLTDKNLAKELEKFINLWEREMPGKSILDIMASEVEEYN